MNVEIEHFQDIDFVSVFCNIEEQEQAKYKGKPIICKDRKLNEFYSDYYEDSFTLVKYERLKELFILEKSFIEKIEKYFPFREPTPNMDVDV